MKICKATNGTEFFIDDEDYEKVMQHSWTESKGYLFSHIIGTKNSIMILHRFVMDCPNGLEIDHKDHHRLNNQKSNLRICTSQQNHYNTFSRGGTSNYKGVYWDKIRCMWKADIRIAGIKKHLGRFKTEIEASEAYNNMALKIHENFKVDVGTLL